MSIHPEVLSKAIRLELENAKETPANKEQRVVSQALLTLIIGGVFAVILTGTIY